MLQKDLFEETEIKSEKYKIIIGMDEAGRGPLAGPVYAAACILPKDFPLEILNDSKKLNEKHRKEAEKIIKEKAIAYAIAFATAKEIDKINILWASMLAMERAYNKVEKVFGKNIDIAYVDGNRTPNLPIKSEAIVKGDSKVPEIMAASILAKNARDDFMIICDKKWPEYEFKKHMGYPTKLHRERIEQYGLCPIHRKTFHFKKTNSKQLDLF